MTPNRDINKKHDGKDKKNFRISTQIFLSNLRRKF